MLFAGFANKLDTSANDKKKKEKPLDAIKNMCKEISLIKNSQRRMNQKLKHLNKRVEKFYELTSQKKILL